MTEELRKVGNACAIRVSRGGGSLKASLQLGLRHIAFTMAEILLSLTIIGVVAAITLPSLTGNINERTWNTQRKALYSRISQAMSLMPNVNGYGVYVDAEKDADGKVTKEGVDTTAETFITAGLSKVLKINNVCDYEHLEDCGIKTILKTTTGDDTVSMVNLYNLVETFSYSTNDGTISYSAPNTKAAAFETANGEGVLTFYNPHCRPMNNYFLNTNGDPVSIIQQFMCVNFIFDLNGTRGPNVMGKDRGAITVFYPTDSLVVMPVPVNTKGQQLTFDEAAKFCKDLDPDYRIPTREEYGSLYVNLYAWGKNFFNDRSSGTDSTKRWTTLTHEKDSDKAYYFDMGNGQNRGYLDKAQKISVNCVMRN